MELPKVENFKRDKPGEDFPWFDSLSGNKWVAIRLRILRRLGLPNAEDLLSLLKPLDSREEVIGF